MTGRGVLRPLLSIFVFLFWSISCAFGERVPCQAKSFGSSSTVCVCNGQSCDTVEPVGDIQGGQYVVYTSSMAGLRLERSQAQFQSSGNGSVTLSVSPNVTYQTIIGFGGAVTDAAGINIYNMSDGARQNLLASYYSQDGIQYNLIRIPMASCDFSTHEYSYDDTPNDFNLSRFALAEEDLKYKIPIVAEAEKLAGKQLRIFGSPWSAPAWMKTDHKMTGKGYLIGKPGGKYFKTWANYFVRFLQEYSKHNVKFWGLTAQNEPVDGRIYRFPFQAMGWTAEMQAGFIAEDLGPALHQNGYSDVKLMILDDQRIFLPDWAKVVFGNETAKSYISGVAVHWYFDALVPPITLQDTHNDFPDKFLFSSEACNGDLPWEKKVILGSWERGESYAHDIITVMNHWVAGWTDWNIALNMEGGPNWVKNFVDSPIIVNAAVDEFYKQPTFYVMGHFSKFVLPGSKRIGISSSSVTDLEFVGVTGPGNMVTLVVLNRQKQDVAFSVYYPGAGYINAVSHARSIQTFLWTA